MGQFAAPTRKPRAKAADRTAAAPQRVKQAASRSLDQEGSLKRHFQEGLGNQAVLRRHALNSASAPGRASIALQAKVQVGAIDAPFEHDADRVADQVMRTGAADSVNPRVPSHDFGQMPVHPSASPRLRPTTPLTVPAADTPESGGEPLEPALRFDLEARFGHDFSRIRIHAGDRAAKLAEAKRAAAYTVGSEIVLGATVSPRTTRGKRVLAHELVHVLQQLRYAGAGHENGRESTANDRDEIEANTISRRIFTSNPGALPVAVNERPSSRIQRSSLGPTLNPVEKGESYLPSFAELATRLKGMNKFERQAFVTKYLVEVRANWTRVEAAGLIAKLDNARSAETQMKTSEVQPLSGFPKEKKTAPTVYRSNLMVDARDPAPPTELGRKLVTQEVTVDSVTESGHNAAEKGYNAAEAVMNLRRLNDVLVRMLSANRASEATKAPLSDVLAIYRAEGDLSSPPSTGSLAGGIPSGTSDATTSINEPSMFFGRPDLNRGNPDLHSLVVLYDRNAVSHYHLSDTEIQEMALREWFVQIGGLDEVGHLMPLNQLQDLFASWSSENWLAAENASSAEQSVKDKARGDARTRWTNLLANVEIARDVKSRTGKSHAVQATPKDPEILIAGILSEAVMRQRALGKLNRLFGGAPLIGADPEMSAGMSYLHYNVGTEGFREILVSAAVAASATSGKPYQQLRTAMKGSLDTSELRTLMHKLDANTQKIDADSQKLKEAKKNGDTLVAEIKRLGNEIESLSGELWERMEIWLRADPARITLLSRFIETAGASDWSPKSWGFPRSSLSRYDVLRQYYSLL